MDPRTEHALQMREILSDLQMKLGVIERFNEEKIFPATVPHLTDEQIRDLGVTKMGDVVSLREKCRSIMKDAVHQETHSVMGYAYSGPPISTIRKRFSSKKIPNRTVIATKKQPDVKSFLSKANSFDKQLHVFKYMGKPSPKSFINVPENVAICGMLPTLDTNSTEEDIRKEIVDIISTEYDQCSSDDFEFIRVSRRSAVVPTVKAGFKWDGKAIKGLARQGAIYVRLTRKFANISSDSLEEIVLSDDDFEIPPACQRPRKNLSSLLPDHMLESTTHSHDIDVSVKSSDDDDISLPEVPSSLKSSVPDVASNLPFTTIQVNSHIKKDITQMFPQLPKTARDALLELNDGSTVAVIELLLNPPGLEKILDMLKAHSQMEENSARLHVNECDQDEMLVKVIEFYKSPDFNPKRNLKVRFYDQPGVDAGGVRRQMFTNVFCEFISSKQISLFQEGPFNLIIHYSVQNVLSGLMVILGRVIAHAIVLEGIGFPHLSRAAFWYLATGDDDRVIGYTSIDDVQLGVKSLLTQLINARTDEDINVVKEDITTYLSQIGSFLLPTLSTKEQITQDIVFHEVVAKPKPLLDQLAEGLKTLDVLTYIRAFPNQFEPLFVPGDHLRPCDVKDMLIKPTLLNQHQERLWVALLEYLDDSTSIELEDFVLFCTASKSIRGMRVMVTFTNQGEFHVSTCLKTITIPDNIDIDQVGTALRALTGRGKGKGKKSFTVV